ncbi:MAG: hypothetical protein KDK03_07840 [Rhodobacteraceae bacterium]|nr:hypothetical protein [Paracoccaceae bacterium]
MAGTIPHGEDADIPEPKRLRQLRLLVNTLTVTLIVGFIIIVATLVIRLTAGPEPLALPEKVTLPAGETAGAVTLGGDWIAVVTTDGSGQQRIRVLDRESGAPRGEMEITPQDQ